MSRPQTRSQSKKIRTEPEPQPEPQTSSKPLGETKSNASSVSRYKSNHESTVRSKNSVTLLQKQEAELAAAERLLELEKSVVQKRLQVELTRLSVHGSSAPSTASQAGRSRVQEWLTSELQRNEQQPPCEPQTHHEHRFVCEPIQNPNMRTRATELTDIQLLAREISSLRKPSEGKELPYYNGSTYEWLSFKAAYAEVSSTLTCTELVSRLRRCLKGEAKETVAALLHSQASASEIMEALELRFGRPELILLEEVRALKDLPKLNDSTEQLTKFACKVQNCVAAMKALNKPEHLHNMELIQTLKLKMPHLKSRWITYAIEHEHKQEPELIKLADFLKKEAQSVSKYWTHEPSRPLIKPTHPNRAHYTEVEEYYEEQDPCYTTRPHPSIEPADTICPYCKLSNHKFLKDCDKFISLSIDDRWTWAKEAKVCFKCLKPRHRRETCRARSCGIDGCRMTHSRLLHAPTVQPGISATITDPVITKHEPQVQNPEPVNETAACSRSTPRTQVLLKIIPIEIRGPTMSKRTYALLDGGSTLTLLKQELANNIGLKGMIEPLTLAGVNATSEEPNSQRVNFEIVGPSNTPIELYGVRTVQNLPLSPQTVADINQFSHLRDLPEAELCYDHGTPELLIGQDNWQAIVSKEIRHGKRNEPVASLTALGWVVHGFSQLSSSAVHFVGHSDREMHEMVENYFKIDSLGILNEVKDNKEDERALNILKNTAKRVEDGKRWEVGLLWREDDPKMPNNFHYAAKRLQSVEKKMDKDPAYGLKYKENMDNFIRSGYAAPCNPVQSPMKWFLPHFGVTNINKPGKLRIVHDAASKVQHVSLNDKLLTGPDLLLSLLAVIFKFREGKVAVSADIKEMFLQIRIRPEDRPAQRFLWREFDRKGPMREHEMKSVIFGATCSPATAIYIKNRNAEDFIDQYPEAVQAIKTRFYMDDYLHSFHSEEVAQRTVEQVAHINQEGGFTLTQWISNSERVMRNIDESKRGAGGVDLNFNVNVKILGLRWNPFDDTLGFNLNFSKLTTEIIDDTRKPTKREALRVVMSVFDPLGLLTPIIIQGKILLQQIWRSGIDWDQEVQKEEHTVWKRWIKRLSTSCLCRVPRHYAPEPTKSNVELHIFCDASEQAFATVAYWRFLQENGSITINLISSKSRVSPLKPVSIPRLELQAALLGAHLAHTIEKDHDTIKANKRYFWTDSSAVIAWIKGDPRNYKTFVSNRLGKIAEFIKSTEWRWLPTSLNVADDATRELDNLSDDHRWFKGPPFLYTQASSWPTQLNDSKHISPDLLERKKQTCSSLPVNLFAPILPDIKRFSKWLRLIRSTAYMFLFIKNTQKKERNGLKVEHIECAEEAWIKMSQSQSFSADLENLKNNKPLDKNSRLRKTCPFIDERGVMRLRGRANAVSDIDHNLIQPIIMDGKHPYTKLLTLHHHVQANHGNHETVVNSLRQKYWIINIRPTVKTAARTCQLCRIRRAEPAQLPHGDLPPARLAHHLRPFTHCGLDYFGPMTVTIGRRHEKRYGALFTCMTSRAVHVELASSLSTDSAILALRRMMARRGSPKVIYSDNATNFRGACTELRRAAEEIDRETVRDFLLNRGIDWSFIPPASPHMGGCWERLIRSIKSALRVTLKEQSPSEEVLRTVLTEAEHTINSRPLTYVAVHPDDREAITPNHLLLGGPSNVPHMGCFTESDMVTRKQWRKTQRLCDLFWKRWVREYLPTIIPRAHVSERPDLKEGDVVIIVDPGLPRNVWPKGIIIKVFPGADGRVRVAEVRTVGGVLRRPAVKIARLPVESAECT